MAKVSGEVETALHRYVDEDVPGDVNEYLDKLGLTHPHFEHRQGTGPFHEDVIGCPYGERPAYRQVFDKHDGWHTIWYCLGDPE